MIQSSGTKEIRFRGRHATTIQGSNAFNLFHFFAQRTAGRIDVESVIKHREVPHNKQQTRLSQDHHRISLKDSLLALSVGRGKYTGLS